MTSGDRSTLDLTVTDVRAFVPARDFDLSRAFYEALGWQQLWTDGNGLALMELADRRFMLQDHFVQAWAENTMLTVEVSDAPAWHRHVTQVLDAGDYSPARIRPVVQEDWAWVAHVWDPSGVLLHFAQLRGQAA